jgi:GTP-binding protein LepA
VDHGKSTLADRMLELTGVKKVGEGQQVLDSNPIEQERGITIKLAPVRMRYKIPIDKLQIPSKDQVSNSHDQRNFGGGVGFSTSSNSKRTNGFDEAKGELSGVVGSSSEYILNLIDTPGHVDFSYEVSRALAACEGAILLVDATQGIQAQTLAHYYQARKLGLKLVPVVNKIDLASAEVEKTVESLVANLGFEREEILKISAKTGEGVEEVLKSVVERMPAPGGDGKKPLRALIFNSHYDAHLGVVAWVRVVDGEMNLNEELLAMGTGVKFEAEGMGYFEISKIKDQISKMHVKNRIEENSLGAGEVGWVVTGLKEAQWIQVGDTVTCQMSNVKAQNSNIEIKDLKLEYRSQKPGARSQKVTDTSSSASSREINRELEPLPGYEPPKAMVWVAFYPTDADEYQQLKEALEKLRLTDSALTFVPEFSPMLGRGFRVGFLGLLHAEIVQERLEREFDLSVFASTASVSYRVKAAGKEAEVIKSPSELPEPPVEIEEPMLDLKIYTPEKYLGAVMQLAQEARGELAEMDYVGGQVVMSYKLPLAELVGKFYDRLKSGSSGFASLDYKLSGWREGDLVKLDVLLAGEPIEALAQIVSRERVEKVGRSVVDKLAEVIPRQQFEVAIQAAIGGKIIARATVKPFRKDVTQKLYGGDQTRKDKLLKKQKKGKKRMKQLGKVQVEPDVFFRLMK